MRPPDYPTDPAERAAFEASIRASVERKVRHYLLDPNHRTGASRAKFLKDVLDFTHSSSELLIDQIVYHPERARYTGSDQHGHRFEQEIALVGVNGRRVVVFFYWFVASPACRSCPP